MKARFFFEAFSKLLRLSLPPGDHEFRGMTFERLPIERNSPADWKLSQSIEVGLTANGRCSLRDLTDTMPDLRP